MKNYIVLLCLLISTTVSARTYNNVQVMPQSGILLPTYGQVLITSPNAVTGESAGACYATSSSSGLVFGSLPTSDGGLGIDASSSNGVPVFTAGSATIETVPASVGGTGQTTILAAFISFFESVATSAGDLIYGGTGGTPTRLAIGTNGQVLTIQSLIPTWVTPAALTAPVNQAFTTNFLTTTGSVSSSSTPTCITSVGSTTGVLAGDYVIDTTHTYIPTGTTVLGIGTGPCSSGQVQMSASSTGTASGDGIQFGGTYTIPSNIVWLSYRIVGGGGGGASGTVTSSSGGGGGGGGGIDGIIVNPTGTITYLIGPGGLGGTSSGVAGTSGYASFFGTNQANGGGGGASGGGAAGTGGTAVINTGSGTIRTGDAGGMAFESGSAAVSPSGGSGGGSLMGGGGASGSSASPGSAALANSGGGGAGGGNSSSTGSNAGSGNLFLTLHYQ